MSDAEWSLIGPSRRTLHGISQRGVFEMMMRLKGTCHVERYATGERKRECGKGVFAEGPLWEEHPVFG